ncbi:MAG TPA: hypothetical protein VJK30_06985 [Coxiellaceae bacterium]|nr:MAG: hypothetical protein A3E81_07760 [Gammaproteobacteria bacterium RIFCSPHIGHO2_12_FULL_36_30]HLB57053.1 hypothetical protein [Coxiellaceae bacterium]
MKTIIFLSAVFRYIDLYNFDAIDKEDNSKFILILGENEKNKITTQHQCCFNSIIFLPVYLIEGEPNTRFIYSNVHNTIKKLVITHHDIKIICIDEGNIFLAAKIRESFNISGPKQNIVEPFTNKSMMHKIIESGEVAYPKSIFLTKALIKKNKNVLFDHIVSKVGFPFILKPDNSSGAFGVSLITSKNDYDNNTIFNDNFNYLASEYITGDLYHCDLQIYKKEILFSGSGMYLNPLLDFMFEKNIGSILLEENDARNTEMRNLCIHILLNVIQVNSGSFHVEFFNRDGQWIFLEAAYRPPGAGLIDLYQQCLGINLCNTDYLLQIDEKPEYIFKNKKNIFIVAAPIRQGTLFVKTPPIIKSHLIIDWRVKDAQYMKSPKSIADKALVAFAMNDNYQTLFQDYLSLKKHSFFSVNQ